MLSSAGLRSRRRAIHRRRRGSADLGGVLVGALAIVLGSAALGILVNHFSPRGIPIFGQGEELQLPLPPGVEAMTMEQARTAWEAKSAVFVDARVPQEFEAAHVPGALNLPPGEFEVRYPDLAEQVEAASTVIVYCEGMECGDSIFVAERLREIYQGAIFVVERGWPAWVAGGYPLTTGAGPCPSGDTAQGSQP